MLEIEAAVLDPSVTVREIPGYLNQGGASFVFRVGDGDVVAKLPYAHLDVRSGTPIERTRAYRSALIRGVGGRCLEQFAGYSLREPTAVLSQFAPGDCVFDMVQDGALPSVPMHEYEQLAAAVVDTQARRLRVDFAPSNLLYAPEAGFTIIDYEAGPSPTAAQTAVDISENYFNLDGTEQECAMMFREACARVLGAEAVAAIDAARAATARRRAEWDAS